MSITFLASSSLLKKRNCLCRALVCYNLDYVCITDNLQDWILTHGELYTTHHYEAHNSLQKSRHLQPIVPPSEPSLAKMFFRAVSRTLWAPGREITKCIVMVTT